MPHLLRGLSVVGEVDMLSGSIVEGLRSCGKRFFRLVQQVAVSAKLINTCLVPVSPGSEN